MDYTKRGLYKMGNFFHLYLNHYIGRDIIGKNITAMEYSTMGIIGDISIPPYVYHFLIDGLCPYIVLFDLHTL